MAGFLYYLSGVHSPPSPDGLAKLGLAYALGAGVACVNVNGGPDGNAGLVVADTRRLGNKACGYYPGEQSWRLIPPAFLDVPQTDTAVWLGYYNLDKPTPEDLLRPDAMRGETHVLGDGCSWIIPVIRRLAVNPIDEQDIAFIPSVPLVYDVDDHGHWTPSRIAPAFENVYAMALRWCAVKAAVEFGEGDAFLTFAVSDDELFEWSCAVLGVNYALGRMESGTLGMMTSHVPRKVLDAAVDWAAWDAWFKKKRSIEISGSESQAPAGSDSSDGCRDATPTTAPLSASG